MKKLLKYRGLKCYFSLLEVVLREVWRSHSNMSHMFNFLTIEVNWDGAGPEFCLSSVLGVLFLYQPTFPQGNSQSCTLENKCFVNLPEVKVDIWYLLVWI